MFVEHSVHVGRPVEVCSAVLAGGPRRWFPRLDDQNRSPVGPWIAGLPLRKTVAVDLGGPVTAGDRMVIPLSWSATFPWRLFPSLVGRIELAPLDRHVTRLTVSGVYEPPLGRFGEHLDEVLMHNVAEGTVQELAESIAKRLETPLCRLASPSEGLAPPG
ncbi:hypothetical protein EPN29_10830 [bacterium]|nr:MAG: hypothetical protein EPN29_10830 [bacterium]